MAVAGVILVCLGGIIMVTGICWGDTISYSDFDWTIPVFFVGAVAFIIGTGLIGLGA